MGHRPSYGAGDGRFETSAGIILLVAIVLKHAAPCRLHQSFHQGREVPWQHAAQIRDAILKELRVRSGQHVPIAKLATLTTEVVALPGDQWLRSVCTPWRLALGVLHHTRYKSKALVHTWPMHPQNAATGARTQVARTRADSHNQLDVTDLLKRFSVDL
jgi:hypothetical protein